jgi:hypothetical protein
MHSRTKVIVYSDKSYLNIVSFFSKKSNRNLRFYAGISAMYEGKLDLANELKEHQT